MVFQHDGNKPERGRDGSTTPGETEARSPEALRHDPPLVRRSWRLSRPASPTELLRELRCRFADTPVQVERLLAHGGLQLDGRPVEAASAELLPGCLPDPVPAGSWVRAWGFVREPQVVRLGTERVLREGAGFLAVDKPAWLPTQRTRASRLGLEDALRALRREPELRPVHRLDRQTSGVTLFARGPEAAAAMQRAFREGRVVKRYLAWVSPPPREDRFEVEGRIHRVPHPRRFCFGLGGSEGRASLTRFRVLERRGERALVEALPVTGRTHQIRVHLAHTGSPVVGDDLYGPPWREGAASAAGRTLLHAERLRWPESGGDEEVAAPLPEDFR